MNIEELRELPDSTLLNLACDSHSKECEAILKERGYNIENIPHVKSIDGDKLYKKICEKINLKN